MTKVPLRGPPASLGSIGRPRFGQLRDDRAALSRGRCPGTGTGGRAAAAFGGGRGGGGRGGLNVGNSGAAGRTSCRARRRTCPSRAGPPAGGRDIASRQRSPRAAAPRVHLQASIGLHFVG